MYTNCIRSETHPVLKDNRDNRRQGLTDKKTSYDNIYLHVC